MFYESLCDANQEVVRECFKLKKYGQINDYYIQNGFVKIINKVGDRPLKNLSSGYLVQPFYKFL